MDPLITAGELGDYLQGPVPEATAELAVRGASGAVRAYCGWTISAELGHTFTVDGGGMRTLGLPTLHLTAVISVSVDGELLDPDTYRWTGRGQLHRAQWWDRWSRVEVVADHGYDPVPDVVRLVALSLAARTAHNPEGLQAATVGSVQRRYDPAMTTLEFGLLAPYRLP